MELSKKMAAVWYVLPYLEPKANYRHHKTVAFAVCTEPLGFKIHFQTLLFLNV
jgi:hypothetical protein